MASTELKFKSPTSEPVHIGLTSGHMATVGPEGKVLPQIFQNEAIACGCIPIIGGEVIQSAQESEPSPAYDRRAVILDAMETLVARAAQGDFLGDGRPDVRALSKIAGFQVSSEERDSLWKALSTVEG